MSRYKRLTSEIEQEFNRLMAADKHKLLRGEAIVEAAEKPTSPLHRYFTWDDTVAAERWRLEEAKSLIQSFIIHNEQTNTTVRVLTSLETDRMNWGGYRWTTDVLEEPNLREQLVQTALVELEAVQNRYQHLVQLANVWESIAEAKAKTVPVKTKTTRKPKQTAVKTSIKKKLTSRRPKTQKTPQFHTFAVTAA